MGKSRLPVALDPDDVDRLMKAPNSACPTGLRNRVILETMYRAGLRVGEVCRLKPSHVNLGRGRPMKRSNSPSMA